jgi:predicted type IV restriction endonuclease
MRLGNTGWGMTDDLQGTVTEAQEYLDSRDGGAELNEAETRHGIIDPLLTAVGWRPIDIRHEYDVQMGSATKKVDSALATGDHPDVFVEAKAAAKDLNATDIDQLKSYMVQEWVQFGLLSNGISFELYYLVPGGEDAPTITLLAQEGLDSLVDSPIPEIVDREHMASGHAEDRADDLLQLDTVRTWLERRPERVETALQAVGSPQPDSERFLGNLFGRTETSSFRYTVELSVGGAPVRVGGDSQSEAMAQVAKYLDREHGLLEKVELPFLGRSRKVPLLNEGRPDEWRRSDDHPSDYRTHEQLRGNVYLYTGLSSQAKRNKISELCEVCGLGEPGFNDAWDGS